MTQFLPRDSVFLSMMSSPPQAVLPLMLATLLLLNACRPAHEGDFYEDARQQGYAELKVMYLPMEGFAYTNEYGELTGVSIDILHEFADFMHASQGIELRYEFVRQNNFSTFYDEVKQSSGGVFGLGNVTITEERKRELRFSPPYLTNIAVLVTHEAVPELRELADISTDFRGMDALAFRGTLHEERLRNLRNTYLEEAELQFAYSNMEIINTLSERDDLFAYLDIYNYWRAVERGKPLRQHSVGDLATERFGIIMPTDSDWRQPLSDFFEQGMGFRTSRTYRAIMERHLGPELTEKLEDARASVVGD
jgi:putative glutamine transport system substrate-binding protein